jgi:hypothetical protein
MRREGTYSSGKFFWTNRLIKFASNPYSSLLDTSFLSSSPSSLACLFGPAPTEFEGGSLLL